MPRRGTAAPGDRRGSRVILHQPKVGKQEDVWGGLHLGTPRGSAVRRGCRSCCTVCTARHTVLYCTVCMCMRECVPRAPEAASDELPQGTFTRGNGDRQSSGGWTQACSPGHRAVNSSLHDVGFAYGDVHSTVHLLSCRSTVLFMVKQAPAG